MSPEAHIAYKVENPVFMRVSAFAEFIASAENSWGSISAAFDSDALSTRHFEPPSGKYLT